MPQIEGHEKLFRDWRGLIAACERNADFLPGREPLTADLVNFLELAEAVKAQADYLAGQRKAETQHLDLLLDRGKEAARKVRRYILTVFDSRDERITQFGITPFRTRVRRTAVIKPTPTEAAKPATEAASAPPPAEETNQPSVAAEKAE
ncbi:MAG TPA: hypothetical protein VGX68_13795 [Thermoanaerobaculia bacterium]|jgi:hypothetical protein|nr:hypothetical protein [Thermoanaerobaculia bacterium]